MKVLLVLYSKMFVVKIIIVFSFGFLITDVFTTTDDLVLIMKRVPKTEKWRNKLNFTCLVSGDNVDKAIGFHYYADGYTEMVDKDTRNSAPVSMTSKHDQESVTWMKENHLSTTIYEPGPIFDSRWESFPIIDVQKKFSFFQVFVFSTTLIKNLILEFYEGKKYSFQLEITPEDLLVSINNCFNSTPCNKRTLLPNLLSNRMWESFMVIRDSSFLSVVHLGTNKAITSHIDVRVGNITEVEIKPSLTHIKIHDFEYFVTKKPGWSRISLKVNHVSVSDVQCFKIWVTLCDTCKLDIRSTVFDEGFRTVLIEKKQNSWQVEKFCVPEKYSSNDVYLHCFIDEEHTEQFWAVSHIEVSMDVRSISTSFVYKKTMFETNPVKCYLVNSSEVIQFKGIANKKFTSPLKKCPLHSFGTNCEFNCEQTLNAQECYGVGICNYDICVCAPGYIGIYCGKECDAKMYGQNCLEHCGHCLKKTDQCNIFTGECPYGCQEDYGNKTCTLTKYPYLLNGPSVLIQGEDYLTMYLANKSYSGIAVPETYIYEVTDELQTLSTKHIDIRVTNFTIVSLSPDTDYSIRAILYTSTGDSYDGDEVPEIHTRTKCKDISVHDAKIVERPVNNSNLLPVTISWPNKSGFCDLALYTFQYLNQNQPLVGNEFTIYPYYASSLEVLVYLNGEFKFEIRHNTSDGVPSEVRNLTITSSTSTSISFQWMTPEYPNGKIHFYEIVYSKENHQYCSKAEMLNSEIIEQAINTNKRLENLTPFTTYRIQVRAQVNKDRKGNKEFVIGTTSGTTEFLEEFEIKKMKTTSFSIQFTIKILTECSHIQGPICVRYIASGFSSWAQDYKQNESFKLLQTNMDIYITDLLASTEYKIVFILYRCMYENTTGASQLFSIKTKPEKPNAVTEAEIYRCDSSYNYVRWKDTNIPPTGEREFYRIIYNLKPNDFKPNEVKCDLWDDYMCYQFQTPYFSRNLPTQIYTKNKDVSELSPPSPISGCCKNEASSPPCNITLRIQNQEVVVTWDHPKRPCGVINSFLIWCGKKDVSVPPLKLTYEPRNSKNYIYTLYNLDCSSTYYISLKAVNGIQSKSGFQTQYFDTLPCLPSFITNPQLLNNTVTTSTIAFSVPPLKKIYSKMSMAVMLSSKDNAEEISTLLQESNNIKYQLDQIKLNKYDFQNLRIIGPFSLPDFDSFVIGDPKISKDNLPLNFENTYFIYVVLMNQYNNKFSYQLYNLGKISKMNGQGDIVNIEIPDQTETPGGRSGDGNTEESSSFSKFWWIILLLIVFVLVFILITYGKYNKLNGQDRLIIPMSPLSPPLGSNFKPDLIPKPSYDLQSSPSTSKLLTEDPKPTKNLKRTPSKTPREFFEPEDSALAKNLISDNLVDGNRISISDLQEYVKECFVNGEFEKQHKMFVRGQVKPHAYGAKPENKSKNRYANLVAYDETRVVLKKLPNVPFSDYINANYIDGYKYRNAYIATQGPKTSTLNDFWRMVWQEKSKFIIMLTNLEENGKKKCEKYWPNIEENEKYGNITVKFVSQQIYADFERRKLKITMQEEVRFVEQLHFTSWPDHGVPLYPKSLVPLMHRIVAMPYEYPIIIHCSAGVGRTGTIILADIVLRMAMAEGHVNILGYLGKIREQRSNLVDSADQYKLVHLVILECLLTQQTNIPCAQLEDVVTQLFNERGAFHRLMVEIDETMWMDEIMKVPSKIHINHENRLKNRDPSIVPEGHNRIFISRYPNTELDSDYINAVYIDGYRQPEKFIVTQQPLPNTLCDFWRLVTELNLNVIVSLNTFDPCDDSVINICPNVNCEIMPVSYLKVRHTKIITGACYDVTTVTLIDKSKSQGYQERTVEIIQMKYWNNFDELPSVDILEFIQFWEEAEKLASGNNILVTCYNGALASGLFVALAFIIEKIRMEHECDVPLAVRTIRRNRTQLVRSKKQFKYLYQMAVLYVDSFNLYANFNE